jgi:hypothetical protein
VFQQEYPTFGDIIAPIERELNGLCSRLSGPRLKQAQWAIVSYGEYIQRLSSRYMALQSTHLALQPDPNRPDEYVQPLQVALVDRTEALFQQIYAAMSAFAVLARLLAPHGALRGIRSGSNSSFVGKIAGLGFEREHSGETKILLEALEFRAKFISHPGTHATYTWMTFSREGTTGIVYFIPKGTGAPHQPEDPRTFLGQFLLPVENDGYYEAPRPEPVLEAFGTFTIWTLRWLLASAEREHHRDSKIDSVDS